MLSFQRNCGVHVFVSGVQIQNVKLILQTNRNTYRYDFVAVKLNNCDCIFIEFKCFFASYKSFVIFRRTWTVIVIIFKEFVYRNI